MKKVKTFHSGDKVFAKVKGYPPWPARVVSINGKRYDVKFYGTGETGIVKEDCLFYYLKHKDQFTKALKRKDYNDAIEEIESEIHKSGTDGNDGSEKDTSLSVTTDDKTVKKRKRSTSEDKTVNKSCMDDDDSVKMEEAEKIENKSVDLSKNQVSRSGRKIKVKKFSDEEDDVEKKQHLVKPKKPQQLPESSLDPDSEIQSAEEAVKVENMTIENCEGDLPVEKSKNIPENDTNSKNKISIPPKELKISDINVVSTDYLQAIIGYAGKVKENQQIYKKTPPDVRIAQLNELVIAKLSSGKLVGIKYNSKIGNYDCEYDQVLQDEQQAEDALDRLHKIEKGLLILEESPNLYETNLQLTESDIEEQTRNKVLEWKEAKFKWFKLECNIIDLDSKIKGCLGLDKAEPRKALEYLNAMHDLEIQPIMLKKHVHIVDMVKRLRKYIGNVQEWNLTGDSLELFETDAEKIRTCAERIYKKFKSIFNIAEEKSFWEEFTEMLKQFKNQTKHLSESEFFMLWHEPESWQTFLDFIYERNAGNTTQKVDDIQETKQDKENLSQVANSENKVEETAESIS